MGVKRYSRLENAGPAAVKSVLRGAERRGEIIRSFESRIAEDERTEEVERAGWREAGKRGGKGGKSGGFAEGRFEGKPKARYRRLIPPSSGSASA